MRNAARWTLVAACCSLAASRPFGGWAIISIQALPAGATAGEVTPLRFRVLQHGVTPVSGLRPEVQAGGARGSVSFRAVPTAVTGEYVANIVLPTAGTWTLVVRSGFGDGRLTLAPLSVTDGKGTAVTATSEERGRQLFIAKGCAQCHSLPRAQSADKAYDVAAPDLTDRVYPVDFLRRQITDPAAAGRELRRESRMPRLGIESDEVEALVEFLKAPGMPPRAAGLPR